MAGAVPATSLGVGFVVETKDRRPFLREAHNGHWYLCEFREGTNWAEIVAEFKYDFLALEACKSLREYRATQNKGSL